MIAEAVDARRFPSATAGVDGTTLLSIYLFLTLAIPSRFVIGPLGGAGSPALVFALGCLLYWLLTKLVGGGQFRVGAQPVKVMAGAFVCAILAAYVAASWRPGTGQELSLATLALIGVFGWIGVLLLAHDEIDDAERFKILIRRIVLGGTLLACFGLMQFATDRVWIDELSIPGLSVNNVIYGVQTREGFVRPSGTAVHPLEFGVVLTMMLPLVMAYAASPRQRTALQSLLRWAPSLIIAVSIFLSGSRSAFVCAAAGVMVVIFRLSAEMRAIALMGCALVGTAVLRARPGDARKHLGSLHRYRRRQ